MKIKGPFIILLLPGAALPRLGSEDRGREEMPPHMRKLFFFIIKLLFVGFA